MLLVGVGCTQFSDTETPPLPPAPAAASASAVVLALEVDATAFEEILYRHGEDLEIDARLTLYRAGEPVLTDEAIELEVKGGVSAAYPQKSLGIKFDDPVANTDGQLFDPPDLLPRHSLTKLRALRLRNGGNDFYGAQLKDLAYTRLAVSAGVDVDPMYGEAALLYVNEQFYGLYRLRNEGNTRGMADLNGVRKRDITLAKVSYPGLVEYKDGDTVRLDRLFDAAYHRDAAALTQLLDLDHFIDYCAFQGLIGNEDWPANNVRFYAVSDGPFRCVLYDLDLAAFYKPAIGPVELITYDRFPNPLREMFLALYATPDFRARFDARLAELKASPALTPAAFEAIVAQLRAELQPLLPYQIERWGVPDSRIGWEVALEELRYDYRRRYAALREQ